MQKKNKKLSRQAKSIKKQQKKPSAGKKKSKNKGDRKSSKELSYQKKGEVSERRFGSGRRQSDRQEEQTSQSTQTAKKSPAKQGTVPSPSVRERSRGSRQGQRHGETQGIIKRHPDGFGFLIPDEDNLPDIYVAKHSMRGAMTSDRVNVRYYPEGDGERLRGEITAIVERRTQKVVGCYHRINEMYGLIMDESHGWGGNIKVWQRFSKDAKDRDYVLVEITEYPGPGSDFQGRVVEIIGDIEDPLNDIRRVILGQNLPHEFSGEAVAEANQYGLHVADHDLKGRHDLRQLKFVTIDGVTAKDFDDAVYCETTVSGFKLWVAIADVSHYVKEGTALDREAYLRGNSTYFPNFVVPMLPENLSNELCSLRPHVPRLAMVAEMTFDAQGQLQNSNFYEAVIESHKRVTYGEAQEILDGTIPENMSDIEGEIQRAADLARILNARRLREGSLDLEISETQVEVDERGEPVDIIRSERLFAHRLIEELMLAANVAVAKFFDKKGLAAIYRVHEAPNEEDISKLERYLHNFGGRAGLSGGQLQKKLNQALRDFANRPQEEILNILTLRMMNQAQYSARNVGHFGLAFGHYTHFTSPIRRYADLIVHRLLKHLVVDSLHYPSWGEERLAQAGTMLSACEQRSVKAERQLVSIKKSRFMSKFVGETFDGMISSVTKFGFFVLLRQYDVDGLIRMEELPSDYYFFDEQTLRLIGKRTGRVYSLGDPVKVQVTSADSILGQINFGLIHDDVEQGSGGGKSRRRRGRLG